MNVVNFNERSYQKELLDADNIPFGEIAQNLKELDIVNSLLGGHAITIDGVKQIARDSVSITICEVGCGGGDNLFALHKYFTRKGVSVRFIGIDKNRECIAYAREKYAQMDCEWICSDYLLAYFRGGRPDIIFTSLFCHHFTGEQLVEMLRWLERNSQRGFFINDLHRHRLAYHFIKYAGRIFSRSYLFKNDAPLSVARGFRREEWLDLLHQADLTGCSIRWKWAFRWLVIRNKKPLDQERTNGSNKERKK